MTVDVYIGDNGYTTAKNWKEAHDKLEGAGDEPLIKVSLEYLKSMVKTLENIIE